MSHGKPTDIFETESTKNKKLHIETL